MKVPLRQHPSLSAGRPQPPQKAQTAFFRGLRLMLFPQQSMDLAYAFRLHFIHFILLFVVSVDSNSFFSASFSLLDLAIAKSPISAAIRNFPKGMS
ncbi:hypothetical protein [Bacillus sp. Marseille-Q3570]|uniref:hypothetical protein n=1 Tax=Bacillus sp. Marseille-Q3570 TaxID=2963522 RepID=UPI0021B757C6|nr:hypothetical protein [Bacillus sp. Marseille-Q3570]